MTTTTTTETFEVALFAPNAGVLKRKVEPGTTVADLLRASKINTKDRVVMIEGRPAELDRELEPRTEVYVVPTVKNALVGVFTLTKEEMDELYRRVAATIDIEELERLAEESRKDGRWYTTAEVLEHLHSLEDS
jgi:sulfur carrier protein ThiS